MTDQVRRPSVRDGYDMWAPSYDTTENPLVFLDRKHACSWLGPRTGDLILDLGCGTGTHLEEIRSQGARPVGLDVSVGMLKQASSNVPEVPLLVSDIHTSLPFRPSVFDAVLCALVSEHLRDLSGPWREVHRVLKREGRFIVTAFHPDLAFGGTEANFRIDGIEYRLGAELHTLRDYEDALFGAGFQISRWEEILCDASVVEAVPRASKYLGRPMLLLMEGRPSGGKDGD